MSKVHVMVHGKIITWKDDTVHIHVCALRSSLVGAHKIFSKLTDMLLQIFFIVNAL